MHTYIGISDFHICAIPYEEHIIILHVLFNIHTYLFITDDYHFTQCCSMRFITFR